MIIINSKTIRLVFLFDATVRAIPANRHAIEAASRMSTAYLPCDMWTVPLRDQERKASSRDAILQSARAYDFEAFHEFGLAAYGADYSLVFNVEYTLLQS